MTLTFWNSVAAGLALCVAGCSSPPPLTLRSSVPCPPGAGSVESWCDEAGMCEFRVTTGGVFICRAGDTASCTAAAINAAADCRARGVTDGPDAGVWEGPPVYAIADWQVHCDSVMGMCSEPPARSVTGDDSESGNVVSCIVSETPTERTVTVTAGAVAPDGTRFLVQVMAARVPRAGGPAAGAGCSTVVTEGANRFVGPCGGLAPSVAQPCQITAEFGYDTSVLSPTTSLHILCDHLPNEAASEQLRSLSLPGSPTTTPAELVFYGCWGQTAD